MKIKNTILLIMLFSSILVTIGCSKTVPKTQLEFQKELLAGTGSYLNTERTWQLDSAILNGSNVLLTTNQKSYKKTYTFDGAYNDTDKYSGKWEINTLNKLKETIIYKTTNSQDSTVYDIVLINSVQLSLSKKSANGQIIVYAFKITN